jgi:arginase
MKSKTVLTPYFLDKPLPKLEELKKPGWILNQEHLSKTKLITRIADLHAALARYIESILKEDNLPLSIAGDCCTALGVYAGLLHSGINPTLIWFDAHGDFNTWETTPSGFLGGMPLAMLAGLGEQTILDVLEIEPIAQTQIILTDARDLDPEEKELVAGSEITHLVDPLELLNISFPDRGIWVHFDTDILDPDVVPAQNYPAPGGPDQETLARVFHHLADTGLIKAVSVSSWAPELPGAEQSKEVSLALLDILCGNQK